MQAKEKNKPNQMKKKKGASASETTDEAAVATNPSKLPNTKQKRLVESKKDVMAFVESIAGMCPVVSPPSSLLS